MKEEWNVKPKKSEMKKLAIILVGVLAMSCTNSKPADSVAKDGETGGGGSTGTGTTSGPGSKKKDSFYDLTEPGYRGQLPYIASESETGMAEYYAGLDIADEIKNPEITWEYFDELYQDNMPSDQKQSIAFTILSTKDLIGLVRNDPENLQLRDALKKYVNVLVSTKYIGYCILYSALEQSGDLAYSKRKAQEIVEYSVSDTFHQSFLNENEAQETRFYRKVAENYSYLRQLRELSEN